MIKKTIVLLYLTLLSAQVDTLLVVDASGYNDWIYFSLEHIAVVDISDPENSLEWDLAFQRKHIKTNSGLSGIGSGGAYVDSSMTWLDNQWENITSLPEQIDWLEDVTLNDFYDPMTHTFGEGIKNPALNSWGWFDEDYHLNVTHYVLYVILANGEDVIKFWPTNYYSDNGLGGYIQFRIETGLSFDNNCDYSLGDINYDNSINVVDIVQLVSYVLNNPELNDCEFYVSDLNQDAVINVIDVVTLVNIIL